MYFHKISVNESFFRCFSKHIVIIIEDCRQVNNDKEDKTYISESEIRFGTL